MSDFQFQTAVHEVHVEHPFSEQEIENLLGFCSKQSLERLNSHVAHEQPPHRGPVTCAEAFGSWKDWHHCENLQNGRFASTLIASCRSKGSLRRT